jgi:competence protein ComEC
VAERRSLIEKRDSVGLVAFLLFCGGVIFGAGFGFLWSVVSAAALCAAALCVLLYLLHSKNDFFRYSLVFVGLFAFLAGNFRMELARPDGSVLLESVNTTVVLEGRIISEPVQKEARTNFILQQSHFSVTVGADRYDDVRYGDIVQVTGILRQPENFTTDQGSEFDYVSYLYKDDILYTVPKAQVHVLFRGKGNPILAVLGRFQKSVIQSFKHVLPAPEAALLSGLLLGTKSSISEQFRNELVETGTIHIIALSGSNVTIVANTFRAMLSRVPGITPHIGSVAGAVGVLLFVTMTGLQSSAIRSGIMAVISIFARSTGRSYTATRALLLAGMAMILWNPKYLVYDVSFHLSFLATLGLIFLVPILSSAFMWVRERVLWFVPLREMVTTTIGAQIAVTPYILFSMGTFSFVSLPANIFILPIIPVVMATGTAAGLIGLFSPALAVPFGYVSYYILAYVAEVVSFFAKVPYASISISGIPLSLCLFSYVLLVIWVYRFLRRIQ